MCTDTGDNAAPPSRAQCSRFALDERPCCVWDWDIQQLNKDFIERFNPGFFEYIAAAHAQALEGENKQHAAVALRTSYVHAMETMFAMIGTILQAPDCLVGWLHRYKSEELKSFTRKIHRRRPILSKLRLKDVSWYGLASAVFSAISLPDKAKEERIKQEFGLFWSRVADEFLDEQCSAEYNGFKHGLRLGAGGFGLAFGLEAIPGQPCPPDKMRMAAGSPFGSTYYVPTPFEGVPSYNIHMVQHSRNWTPENFECRLRLISMSLRNLISFLRLTMRFAPTGQFAWPDRLEVVSACWEERANVLSSSFNLIINKENITAQAKEQIIDVYRDCR